MPMRILRDWVAMIVGGVFSFMAVESFYFSHDYNARSDRKMLALQMAMGVEGIGIYWCVVEMLYEEGGYLMLSECERIAFELRTDKERITKVIDSDLFSNDGMRFWSESILKRLGKRYEKSEKAKKSAEKRWKDANAMRTHSDGNAIKERKEKERKENIKDIGTKEGKFIIINSPYATESKYRIWGVSGLKQYLEMVGSRLPRDDYAEKFIREKDGQPFDDFGHVLKSYNLFIE
jgi:hypothetical protein